ncbi:MAG TPA: hypothetical protein VFR13_04035 [Jiangellaceae bacterium]|nr:hypothetical protein [Jiangellaceae bacterium]
MNTVVAGIVAALLGAALAVAAAITIVNVVSGPSPEEVAQERAAGFDAEDLAYGGN